MILGSATLTMVVSRITMKALRAMTTSTCQWYGTVAKCAARLARSPGRGWAPSGWATVAMGMPYPRTGASLAPLPARRGGARFGSWLPRQREIAGRLADLDSDLHRGAERQDHASRVDDDLHGDVLGDFGEVAGGVVGGQ